MIYQYKKITININVKLDLEKCPFGRMDSEDNHFVPIIDKDKNRSSEDGISLANFGIYTPYIKISRNEVPHLLKGGYTRCKKQSDKDATINTGVYTRRIKYLMTFIFWKTIAKMRANVHFLPFQVQFFC